MGMRSRPPSATNPKAKTRRQLSAGSQIPPALFFVLPHDRNGLAAIAGKPAVGCAAAFRAL